MNQDILKGILVILVVIDHNEFSRSIFPAFLEGFSFHVVGFMMIPFLRPAAPLDRQFVQYLYRLYHPFLVIVTLMAVVVALMREVPLATQIQGWALALYSGNHAILKQVTGMALLWFLPSFVAMVAIRTMTENAGGILPAVVIALLWALHPFIGSFGPGVQHYLPLGLLPAVYVIPLAYLGVYLHRTLFARMGRASAAALSAVIFALVKWTQMRLGLTNEVGFVAVADYTQPLALLINDAEAISGVLMLFQSSRYAPSRLLAACGRYSLQIYLLHAFVALLVYKALLAMRVSSAPLPLFLVSAVATVLLTLGLSRLLDSQARIKRLVFPRSIHDLIGCLPPSGTTANRNIL